MRKRGSFMTAPTISSNRANGPAAMSPRIRAENRERERESSSFLPTFQLANMAESVADAENTAIDYTAAVWPVGTRPFSGRKLSRRRLVFQKAAVKQRECSGVATPASLRAIGTGPSILVFATPPVLLLSICAPCFYPLTYRLFFSFFSSAFLSRMILKRVSFDTSFRTEESHSSQYYQLNFQLDSNEIHRFFSLNINVKTYLEYFADKSNSFRN